MLPCRLPLEPSNPPQKCNKEDKRNFQDMMRIKQFDSLRRGVARHADDLPRRAVLSRWLTLEGGAGPGIKADSLPHSSTLKAGLRGEHLLPISWHRSHRRAPQLMRLVFPADQRDPLGPSPRRLPRGVCLIQFRTGAWLCSVWKSWIKKKKAPELLRPGALLFDVLVSCRLY